ncbi:MAG: TetR/AcrR family transcriptional regulator [Ruminococcus sp.]|nr:TetR/AcrR family transcriptional regulator [Ruminococcus sp.]
MFHKGLSKELVVKTAKDLIEENGYANFSMHMLADSFGIKTASLYTHIKNMDELLTEVGKEILQEQKNAELSAIGTQTRDKAILALADAYRKYAKEHKELYRFIMNMQTAANSDLKDASSVIVEPFMFVLRGYRISEERKMHWQRILRGTMHGFVSQEEFGYFLHYPVDIEESYRSAIQCLVDGLRQEEADGCHEE